MRLWSLHPQYLDAKGLVALWREGLLAQAVLRGETRGYQRHPQLDRFREAADPSRALAVYLGAVVVEATARGYRFDGGKLGPGGEVAPLTVTVGQLELEWAHLTQKLATRAPAWLQSLATVTRPEPHPLFRVIEGRIAPWERASAHRP